MSPTDVPVRDTLGNKSNPWSQMVDQAITQVINIFLSIFKPHLGKSINS